MVIKNKRNMCARFDSIDIGNVFIVYDTDICMKIEDVDDDYGIVYNAVNLYDGHLACFNNDDIVQPVKCELIIE